MQWLGIDLASEIDLALIAQTLIKPAFNSALIEMVWIEKLSIDWTGLDWASLD